MSTSLGFQCCFKNSNDMLFSSIRGNGLFRYNGEHVEYLKSFDEEGIKLFSDIKEYKEKLYFIPLVANRIYIYDLLGKEMQSIPYEEPGKGDFIFTIRYDHFLYLFPSYYSGILKLNLDTMGIEKIDDWLNGDFAKYKIADDAYFRGDYIREKDTVYIPFCNAHAVLEFRLNDGSSIIHDVGSQGYATIASDGKRYWMAPRKSGNIVSWNPFTDEVTEFSEFPTGFLQGAFIGSFYESGYVWIFPESANMVLKVNVNTGEIIEDKLFSDICKYKWTEDSVWGTSFIYMRKEPDKVLLCSGKSGEMVSFYPDKNRIERFKLRLPDGISQYYQEKPDTNYILYRKRRFKRGRGKAFQESKNYSLRSYIEDVEEE